LILAEKHCNLEEGSSREILTILLSVEFELGLGVLDSDFNTITGVDHLQLGGPNFGANAEAIASATDNLDNPGVTLFNVDLAAGEGVANIARFATTPGNNQDDFFSGVTLSFEANETDGEFADGSTFNLSFDGALVPEPSSTSLLGLGALALLCRRSRKA